MRPQISTDDEWDLIPFESAAPFVQPTAKATPLSRPAFDLQPRLPVSLRVPMSDMPALPRPPVSGPKLTVANLSDAQPHGIPQFSPVRHSLSHHVSHVDSPYARFHRVGYQPASLQTLSSSTSLLESEQQQESVPALCPSTSKALPCPPLNKGPVGSHQSKPVRSSTAMQLTRSKFASDNVFLVEQFTTLLGLFGQFSDVYQTLSSSPYADEHRKRLLNNYAATTACRYMQAVQKFVRVTSQLGFDVHRLSEAQLADTLTVMQLSRTSDTDRDVCSGNFTIKALRWWHKIAGVQNLQICFSPLVDSFLKTKLSRDRREAPPLPLWLLFQWERRILQSASTVYEIMMLGSFLVITWAGLRFADAQRLNVDSLVFNFQELRGLVWRSKTMSAGHPFGVQASGLCSLSNHTWLFKFLQTWDTVMHELQMPRSRVDFLIPSMSPDGTFPVFEPLDYAGTTRVFRDMLVTPWKRFEGEHPLAHLQQMYTLHSMKATLLSFGPQLGSLVSDSDRLLQGHHQDPKHSLNLYGRDSVWGSLRYQATVIQEIHKGWRPKTAQHRGGQFPLVEPVVTLERFRKSAPDYQFKWFSFSGQEEPTEIPSKQDVESIASDTNSDSSSSQSDSSDSEDIAFGPKKVEPPQEAFQADEAVYAKHRRVTHAMLAVVDGVTTRPFYMDHYWKAACGARMLHSETEFLETLKPPIVFCQHAGCKKIWTSVQLG